MGARDFEDLAGGPGSEDRGEGDYQGTVITDDDKLDLRQEVFEQIRLLKNIRGHLFNEGGSPKIGTEFKDIRAYLSSSTQLLTMLQKFEEALKTDEDFAKVEMALEKAMEECPVPEFAALLRKYLEGEI